MKSKVKKTRKRAARRPEPVKKKPATFKDEPITDIYPYSRGMTNEHERQTKSERRPNPIPTEDGEVLPTGGNFKAGGKR